MKIELIVTGIIAVIGWVWAITQFCYKRKWQKHDAIAARRYDAYSRYMRKYEEISENVRKDPQAIYGINHEFMVKVMRGSSEEINNAVIDFNQQLLDYVKRSCEPLLIVKQELNALFLIASSDLLTKLDELKELITDFNNETQNCLSQINVKDGKSFQVLNTLGQTTRWQKFKELNEDIISLMRKEIDIK